MKLLFVHQNFPGQYKHLAPHYAANPHNTVITVAEERQKSPMPRIRHLSYPKPGGASPNTHHYLLSTEASIRRGQAVFRVVNDLPKQGFHPDVICVHPGWGEGLFLKDVFPRARILSYWEFFYSSKGADVGFDRENGVPSLDAALHTRVKNATQLMSFAASDWGISPTHWQRSRFPAPWRAVISSIHDGIDTNTVRPNPQVVLKLSEQKLELTRQDEVITYVARNLEPYRGFHIVMRALPDLLRRRPKARVLFVGGDEVSYGKKPAEAGLTWREKMMGEVGAGLDMSRVHFLGKVPYSIFLKILQVSSAHVYLTYPFVLSWSMLEAMSAGCLVVGSRTGPVEEVIADGSNGLLFDFFKPAEIVERVCEALDTDRVQLIRQQARQTAVERYDLKSVCLPQQLALIESLAAQDNP